MIIYTGERGAKYYLYQFFKPLDIDDKELDSKVEEAYKEIVDNPNTPNIFGIKVYGN